MKFLNSKFLIVPVLLLMACDHGLEPPKFEAITPGIEGKVIIVDEWREDVVELRVVAFLDYPPNDIVNDVLSGRAQFTDPLEPLRESYYDYSLDLEPNTYQYIVAAARIGPDFFTDWIVVGVYSTDGNPEQPSSVTVSASDRVTDVDITVTMQSLPPQPFFNETAQ